MTRFFLLSMVLWLVIPNQHKFEEVQAELIRLENYGDKHVIDSLYHLAFELGKQSHPEELAQLYALYGARHISIEPNLDTCYFYLKLSEKISTDKKYYRSLAKAQIHLGHYYNIKGEREKSINYILAAKKNVKRVEDEKIKTNLTIFIGTLAGDIFESFSLYDSALTNYQQSIDYGNGAKDIKALKALNQMGNLYARYGENDKARTCFMKLIQLSKKGHYLASAYHNLGDLFYDDHAIDSTIFYYKKAFEIRKNENRALHTVSTSLAKIYAELQLPDSSFYYLALLDTSHLSSIDHHNVLSAYTKAFLVARELGQAKKYNKYHIDRVSNLSNLSWHIEALENRMKIEKSEGDFKKAFYTFESLKLLQDSLLNIEKVRSLMELDTRYDMNQREQVIASLAQRNEIQQLLLSKQKIFWISSVLILLLVFSLVILLFRRRSSRAKERQLLLEQNLLRTQMNPHFIFNTLASIQGFITQNDRKEAATFLAKFGELTRDILDASRKELIPLSKELEMMENYVALEQARFSKSLILEVDHSSLDASSILISPMIIQPFIENAIKHGFKGREEGVIRILFLEEANTLKVTIEDNGSGIESDLYDKEKSLATKIVKERLQLMRSKTDDVILTIQNIRSDDGQIHGVQVNLNLPLRYAQ